MKMQPTAAAVALLVTMGAASWAQVWNKKTNLEVKETILIPGKELPPGKYVMKLMDSISNRNIVQVFNEDETQLQATILAIPNYRLERTGDTELRYWESASGTPPALRAWFYPGDNYGQEFAYPKEVAEQIAARNNAKVAWYEGAGDPDSLRSATIHGPESESSVTQTAPTSNDEELRVEARGSADRLSGTSAAPEPAASNNPQGSAATTQTPQESSEPSMAQPAAPAQEQETAQSRDQRPAPYNEETPAQLPSTGSPLWTMAIAGAVMLALGTGFARSRRRAG